MLVHQSLKAACPWADGYFTELKTVLRQNWKTGSALVCVAAAGAVARCVAPLLKSKQSDPALLVLDEQGRFVVPLSGGHAGGANALAQHIAGMLGGQAVITTASDTQGLPALDLLGRELGWTLEATGNATQAASALVNAEPVAVVQECGATNWLNQSWPPNLRRVAGVRRLRKAGNFKALLVITDRATAAVGRDLGANAALWKTTLLYRPKTLWVGMGCRRGVKKAALKELLSQTFKSACLSEKSISGFASLDLKMDEPGLLDLARDLGVPVRFFSAEALNQCKPFIKPSALVEIHTGAWGVAEPAALLAAGVKKLVVRKMKNRMATIAVARREN